MFFRSIFFSSAAGLEKKDPHANHSRLTHRLTVARKFDLTLCPTLRL